MGYGGKAGCGVAAEASNLIGEEERSEQKKLGWLRQCVLSASLRRSLVKYQPYQFYLGG